MNWIILIIAGLLEVGWAVGLKHTEGFTRFWPSVLTIASMAVSLVLLAFAMKTLPTGAAYAVWVGVGVVGTALAGIFLMGESAGLMKSVSLLLIMVGIVGLKITATD